MLIQKDSLMDQCVCAYGVADDDGRVGTEVSEVESNFHASVAATNNENLLVLILSTVLVATGVEDGAAEVCGPTKRGCYRLSILTGGDHEPAGAKLFSAAEVAVGLPGGGVDVPELRTRLKVSQAYGVVEERLDPEVVRVLLQVRNELILRGISWIRGGER